ncbi:MAG: iron ABC transporter permease [Bacteroidales bacterium]|nr:iron ABC transporter permease [Bacteroidales bacterium]
MVTQSEKVVNSKRSLIFVALLLLVLLFFFIDIVIGNAEVPVGDLIRSIISPSEYSTASMIFYNFRLPKALAAVITGVALGISGLLTQTYFRNPLAGPDVLGISSGASLGVAFVLLVISQFLPSLGSSPVGNWTIIVAACVGAAATMLMITLVSGIIRDHVTMLVFGLMVGAAFSSAIIVIQYLSNETLLKSFVVWGFGSIRHLGLNHLAIMSPFIALGTLLSFFSVKNLNALLIGEKYAQTMGINLARARVLIFISIILLAGTITAFCGPIAFVAITVPHLSRMLLRTNDHFVLIVASLLTGSLMMLLSDILSHLPGSNISLPINALTSLMGIPLIIAIILRKKI